MTPPDAMSWDEASKVLAELIRRFTVTVPTPMNRYGESSIPIEHFVSLVFDANRALAAIQSHRVQAEADAVDARRYRWLRDHHIFSNDSMQELWFSPYVKPNPSRPPGDLDKSIDIEMAWSRQIETDAALAAAANNDGGSNENLD